MDIIKWAEAQNAIIDRFENGEALDVVAADLGVPPKSIRGLYHIFLMDKLESEIEARPSFQQLQKHRELGQAAQVLSGNSDDLLAFISDFESGRHHESVLMMRNPGKFFATLERLLHNYVAAAVMLVYHIDETSKEGAFRRRCPEVYREQFSRYFYKNDLAMFVRRLRNKTLKEHFSSSMAATSSGTDGHRFGPVSVSIEPIPQDKVDKYTFRYLTSRNWKVNVREMVETYQQHIHEFIEWLLESDLSELSECHAGLAQDLRRLKRLSSQSRRVTNLPFLAQGLNSATSSYSLRTARRSKRPNRVAGDKIEGSRGTPI